MTKPRLVLASAVALLALAAASVAANAQIAAPGTFAEFKTEVQQRADRKAYPVSELDAAEVREAAHAQLNSRVANAAAPGSIASMGRGTVFRDCDGCPEMVVIPAGSFTMGSPASDSQRDSDEGPQHRVTIPRPFAAGKYEVTRGQFARFVQEAGYSTDSGCFAWDGKHWNNDSSKDWRNPGFAQTDNDPVSCVNWNDASAYVEWLARKTGQRYRLPTEAEWDYAARAGTTTAFSFGDRITPQQANYDPRVSDAGSPVATARGRTAPVGSYPANAFGLYDVHGNVLEWTEDCYNRNYNGAPSDGSAWTSGDCTRHVLRGGSWGSSARSLRSADREGVTAYYRFNFIGFRILRTD